MRDIFGTNPENKIARNEVINKRGRLFANRKSHGAIKFNRRYGWTDGVAQIIGKLVNRQ